jgi:hypothetical protein
VAANKYRPRWRYHRRHAKDRKIPFLLTFDQWLQIWIDSGHIHESGTRNHQYCMARYGDKGPYAVGNVRIVTVAQNHAENTKGKFKPGVKSYLLVKNRKPTAERIAKMRSAQLRLWSSPAHHRKMSEAARQAWQRRKQP